MHHLTPSKRTVTAVAAASLLLLGLLLSACGSSSSPAASSTAAASSSATTTSSTHTSTSGASTAPGSTSTTPAAPSHAPSGRFAALRACLAKNGITLPTPTHGKRPTGGFLGGGFKPPSGVSRAKYEAALKKCGGGRVAGAGRRFKGFTDNPRATAALTKFAACMREHGVEVPNPNTTGSGPIFNTSGLNTSSAKFRTAESKCSALLRGAFGRRRPGSGHPPPAGGAPPAK